MMRDQDPHGEGSKNHKYGVNERTALLASANGESYMHTAVVDESESDSEEAIGDNEFDDIVARSELITTGLGIEPESQEVAILRGPRRYSGVKEVFTTAARASLRRKSLASTVSSNHGAVQEAGSEEEDNEPKSPFLAGVSVGRFWLIFGGILITYFISCFDMTIMVSSHPVITSYFHSSNSASWLSTAFLLTSTSFQPLFGRLSDTIGRKPPYIFTMIIFTGATVWCALAQSMTSFILARALCGLGAGGMLSMGSIITSDLVPIEIRGIYQSYINIIYGIGSAAGAALGGAIADSLGWRWEFGIQVPLVLICLGIAMFTVPRKLGLGEGVEKKTLLEAMKVFDFKGSFLLTTSVTFLILGLNLGGNVYPWSHPFVISSLIIFCIAFPTFIYVESHVDLPIMPLKLIMRNPRAGLILGNGIGAIIANAVTFNIPLYFQAVLLESATSSGLHLVAPSIVASFIGTATGFLITWTKQLKWLLVLGVSFLLAGTFALSFIQRGLPDWAYILFIIPSSIGQGFMFPATFMAVLAVSPQSEQAVVTSTLILWRSIGMVLGVALSSLLLQNALLHFLSLNVTGPDAASVIEQVRKSVEAIRDLDSVYKEMVVDSYAQALRVTFAGSAVLSIVTVAVTLPLKLPRLGERK